MSRNLSTSAVRPNAGATAFKRIREDSNGNRFMAHHDKPHFMKTHPTPPQSGWRAPVASKASPLSSLLPDESGTGWRPRIVAK